jgi:hypothetical protein
LRIWFATGNEYVFKDGINGEICMMNGLKQNPYVIKLGSIIHFINPNKDPDPPAGGQDVPK